ncbi:MAG: acetoacetate--CoA ligase, partial [Deltaproteobacteria bacterium]|nr:acetoacetate--CoA ligase [Deltaproteobacteria bacterium]
MGRLLWKPSEERVRSTNMYRFMNFVNEKFGKDFREYASLYEWSVEDIPNFWSAMWEFADIRASRPYDEVVDDAGRLPGAEWFSGARL